MVRTRRFGSSCRSARPAALAVLALVGGLVAGCGGDGSAGAVGAGKPLRVVAAENFWGDIARQLGGSHVRVTSLIAGVSADPHLYESSAHNAADVAGADIVIANGLGYDDFVGKLLSVTRSRSRHVLTVSDVLRVSGADANPHLWYDAPRIPEVAQAITAALIARDPLDQGDYRANLQRFNDALRPLLALLETVKAKYPLAPVAYIERVPGYLVADAGLRPRTPVGFARAIEDGNEPSPGDRAAMEQLMTGRQVRVLLYNEQTTSRVTQHIRDLAQAHDIPVVGVTETMPAGDPSFQAWQLRQVAALLAGLGG